MISYTSSHSMWYIRLSVSVYIILHFSRYSGNMYSWWNSYKHVLDMSRMHISTSDRTSPRVYAFLLLLDFLKRRFDYENLVSRTLPPRRISRPIKSRTSTWLRTFCMVLPNTSLFINLYKFSSKSLFARVLKFVFNWIKSRSHGDCANFNIRWIFVTRRPWRV